ncbi:glutathione peroxidase [Spirochaeta lutea]|uniref:Glutathione peroxidase n=1 Tax=Spirochaeta lutea TaxID=1480694 RepID=A0A098QTC3_9SPIO|nr:glutathione peroxidase [Spirochaeta lutea]KGE70959.1 glutathione peroxidase [Spirochaeta lutea]
MNTTKTDIYQLSLDLAQGGSINLADLRNNPVLIVNTATRCGLAPQFEGLEELHQEFFARGLRVIGLPSNQFADQEPETDETVTQVCKLNHGVTFPLTKKVLVNGPQTHPLLVTLKEAAPGFLGARDLKWNFTKFLIWPGAHKIKRYAPTTKPQAIRKDIRRALEASS